MTSAKPCRRRTLIANLRRGMRLFAHSLDGRWVYCDDAIHVAALFGLWPLLHKLWFDVYDDAITRVFALPMRHPLDLV